MHACGSWHGLLVGVRCAAVFACSHSCGHARRSCAHGHCHLEVRRHGRKLVMGGRLGSHGHYRLTWRGAGSWQDRHVAGPLACLHQHQWWHQAGARADATEPTLPHKRCALVPLLEHNRRQEGSVACLHASRWAVLPPGPCLAPTCPMPRVHLLAAPVVPCRSLPACPCPSLQLALYHRPPAGPPQLCHQRRRARRLLAVLPRTQRRC